MEAIIVGVGLMGSLESVASIETVIVAILLADTVGTIVVSSWIPESISVRLGTSRLGIRASPLPKFPRSNARHVEKRSHSCDCDAC